MSVSLGILSGFLIGTSFAASGDFPKKEITIIVNLAPGGARDTTARGVANTMGKYLGVPMVVVNLPGAGGSQGIAKTFNSANDGYTIGIGGTTDIMQQILEKQDYDSKKFAYIGKLEQSPSNFFVKTDSPFRSVKDFKTFGKKIRYSTHSLTTTATVAAIILEERVGFPLVIVGGYKGGSAAVLGLVRGEVEFSGVTRVSAMPFVQSGQIRPILTIDQIRSPYFPDIPTTGELGWPDLEILANTYWFMAPPGVPKDRMKILEDALMKTLKDPEFLKWAKGAGVDPSPLGAQETGKLVFNCIDFFEKYKKHIEKYIEK